MGITPIAAIGPAVAALTPVFTPLAGITPAAPAATPTASPSNAKAASPVDGGYYLVSGPAFQGASAISKLEDDLTKAALLIGLMNEDDENKTNPLLDLIIASAVVKMYEQMAALGTTAAVGFVGDGAGGAVGISVSVKA
jgi:hypothetical protein